MLSNLLKRVRRKGDMAKLQRPPYVFMDGKVTEWDDAKIHVASEAVIRGISVFEGIKGYWNYNSSVFSLLALREHFERLKRSAMLQHLPFTMNYEESRDNSRLLSKKLLTKERDLWLRPTLLAVEGNWGEDTVTDLVITGYQQEKKRPEAIELGISTWQRPFDTGLPTRIKSAANYQSGRFARIEGRRQGFGDMILLNSWGRVAEATGSCVLIVREGRVATPPSYEGCLESITINIVQSLCRSLDIPFDRRPIDRSELLVADEIGLAGTLMEIGVIRRLNERQMPFSTQTLDRIADEYWACVRGESQNKAVQLTAV